MPLLLAGVVAGGALFIVLLYAIYQLASRQRSGPRGIYLLLGATILGAIAMLSSFSSALGHDLRHRLLLALVALAVPNALALLWYERGVTAKLTGVVTAAILLLIWQLFPGWGDT